MEKPRHEGSGQGVWENGDTDPYWDALPPLPEYDRQELPHLQFPGTLVLPGVGPAPGAHGLHASQQHLRRTELT